MIMKKILFAFNLLLLSTIHSYSSEIVVEGNKRINKETIKVYGDIKNKNEYSNTEINTYLKNLYETNFFENI